MDDKSKDNGKEREKEKDHDASKLERLLSSHSLEGLVYEKRQRKKASNALPSIFPQIQHVATKKNIERPYEKKKQEKVKKQQDERQKEKEKEKKLTKKKMSKESSSEEKEKDKIDDNSGPRKRGRPKKGFQAKKDDQQWMLNKDQPVQQQINDPENEKEVQQQEIPPTSLRIGFKKFTKTESTEQKEKQQQSKRNEEANQNRNKQITKEEKGEGQQQPKIHKITRVHSVSELKQSIREFGCQKEASHQPEPEEQPEVEASQEEQPQNQPHKAPIKRPLRLRKKNPPREQQNQPQDNQQSQSQQENRKRRSRVRKTKDQAMKKFTMLQAGSQQDYLQNPQPKRRKPIQKQYQINRIFRKTQKASLPNIKLQVDLLKMSLQIFSQKFKQFDMIHCSVPLEMLMRMPGITSLIGKGFIFVWVEKGEIQAGYHWLNRMGFDVIDQIVWVRTNKGLNEISCDRHTAEQVFPNCISTCLVGYKCSTNQRTEYCTKISNNIIFQARLSTPLEKPDQIYEIGDLMMPGAKKLEIGFKEVGGWLTLKHREEARVTRCYQCLGRGLGGLYIDTGKRVVCGGCLEMKAVRAMEEVEEAKEQDQEQKQQKEKQQIKIDYSGLISLKVVDVEFESISQPEMRCSTCKKRSYQLLTTSSFKPSQFCKDCLVLPESDPNSQITVLNIQQPYFTTKQLQCSKCLKKCLNNFYYECFTCKEDHILCSTCMMETAVTRSEPKEDGEGKGEEKYHEWKLKVLTEFPETKAVCFECREECGLPYWGCETCQNWYWCGRCKSSPNSESHGHHCHYNRKHHLHLII